MLALLSCQGKAKTGTEGSGTRDQKAKAEADSPEGNDRKKGKNKSKGKSKSKGNSKNNGNSKSGYFSGRRAGG